MSSLFFKIALKFEFGAQQRYKFYVKLSQLLDNGVGLDIGLKQIEKIAQRKSSKVMQTFYRQLRRNIENGMNFGQCMAEYIPNSEAILLETGSNSGRLIQTLQTAADSIVQQRKVKMAIISNGAYPALLFAMLIGAMFGASYQIIPTLTQMLPVEKWTGIPYGVAMVAEFIRNYTFSILGTSGLLIFIIMFSMPRWKSRMRVAFDAFPPWSLYRIWQGSSFLLALASMMTSGVKLDEVSLGRISKQADPYLRQRIRGLIGYITAGDNLGEALFKTGYKFPDEEIIGDLQIYANLRGFDHNLIWITRTWVDSLVEQVTITMRVINIAVLFLIAIVIGCLIFSFYDVIQQIQSQLPT